METSKYRCLNKQCANFGITVETDNNVCSQCFEIMNEAFEFNANSIGKYGIADAKERKAMLKKRAQDHDNSKNVQEMIRFKKLRSLGLTK